MAAVRLRLRLAPDRFFVSEPVPVSIIRERGGLFAAIDDLDRPEAGEITVELDTLLGLQGITTEWATFTKMRQILIYLFGLPWSSRSYEAWTSTNERRVLDALVETLSAGGPVADTLSVLGGLELQALASMLHPEHGTPIWTCLRRSHVCQLVAGLYWHKLRFEDRNVEQRARAVSSSTTTSADDERTREMWEPGVSYAVLAEAVCQQGEFDRPAVVRLATDLFAFLLHDRQEAALAHFRTLQPGALSSIASWSLDVEATEVVRWILRELPGRLEEHEIELLMFRSLAQPAFWDLSVDLVQATSNITAIATGNWFATPWIMSPASLERFMKFLWNDDTTRALVFGLDLSWDKVLYKALDTLASPVYVAGDIRDDDEDSLVVPVYRGVPSSYDRPFPKRTGLGCVVSISRDNFRASGISINDAKKRICECVEIIAGHCARNDIMNAVRFCFETAGLYEALFRIVRGSTRNNRDWTDNGFCREFIDFRAPSRHEDDMWFVALALRTMFDNTDHEASKHAFARGILRVITSTTVVHNDFMGILGHIFHDVNFGPLDGFELVASALEPWPREDAGKMCLNFFGFARQLDGFPGEPWCAMLSRVYARCYAAKIQIERQAEETGITPEVAAHYRKIKDCLNLIGGARRVGTKPTIIVPAALAFAVVTRADGGGGGGGSGGAAAGGGGGGAAAADDDGAVGSANPYSAAKFTP